MGARMLRHASMLPLLGLLAACHQQAPESTTGTQGSNGTIRSNEEAGRMVTPAMVGRPLRELVGQRVEVDVDLGRHGNDVAFWSGSGPDDVLAVIERDLRSADERAAGRPAERAMDLPRSGVVRLGGTIEAAPSAEGIFGWGLTEVDVRRLAEQGVYLRLHEVVRRPG